MLDTCWLLAAELVAAELLVAELLAAELVVAELLGDLLPVDVLLVSSLLAPSDDDPSVVEVDSLSVILLAVRFPLNSELALSPLLTHEVIIVSDKITETSITIILPNFFTTQFPFPTIHFSYYYFTDSQYSLINAFPSLAYL